MNILALHRGLRVVSSRMMLRSLREYLEWDASEDESFLGIEAIEETPDGTMHARMQSGLFLTLHADGVLIVSTKIDGPDNFAAAQEEIDQLVFERLAPVVDDLYVDTVALPRVLSGEFDPMTTVLYVQKAAEEDVQQLARHIDVPADLLFKDRAVQVWGGQELLILDKKTTAAATLDQVMREYILARDVAAQTDYYYDLYTSVWENLSGDHRKVSKYLEQYQLSAHMVQQQLLDSRVVLGGSLELVTTTKNLKKFAPMFAGIHQVATLRVEELLANWQTMVSVLETVEAGVHRSILLQVLGRMRWVSAGIFVVIALLVVLGFDLIAVNSTLMIALVSVGAILVWWLAYELTKFKVRGYEDNSRGSTLSSTLQY